MLARELSLAEIAALDTSGLQLEAFVHGALCYGYSGDCLLSSMVGGRSGNRGRCSQSCRLRYAVSRADAAPAGAAGEPAATRVMSTSDLAAIDVLPRLVAAGVTSLKLEGRMKDAAYVGVTTAVYREALDAALADPGGYQVRREWRASLEQSFSRSFTTAHLDGRHHEVRSSGRGGHRGVLVGRVARVGEADGSVEVRLSQPVSAGDVVYLYTPWGQSEPQRLEQDAEERLVLRVRERVAVKDRLFRLSAADTGKLAQDLVAGRVTLRPVPLSLRLEGAEGEPAALTATCGPPGQAALSVRVESTEPLAPARTAGLTAARARVALAALGGTPYGLSDFDYAVADGLFLAVGDLKELRRTAVAELDRLRLDLCRRAPAGRLRPDASPAARAPAGRPVGAAARPGAGPAALPPVVLLLRPGERPLAAPAVGALCLDVFASDGAEAIEAAARELAGHGLPLRLRLPEILFDADESWWRALLAVPWQGVYARHLGVLAALAGPSAPRVLLEYPLQGLNGLSPLVAGGLGTGPPEALVVSPEASFAEVAALPSSLERALGGAATVPRLEILAFGRQQVLRTRDRLGLAEGLFEAPGPAEHVGLVLEDVKGFRFPADVDEGGTRLFNARVTNLAPHVAELLEAGVGSFLVVQSDLDAGEREAFRGGGLPALAPFAARERSTTGHLFRGVA